MDKSLLIPTEFNKNLEDNPQKRKELIRELGRRFEQTAIQFLKEKGSDVHTSIILGACEYIKTLQERRMVVVGNHYLKLKALSDQAFDKVEEPFSDKEQVGEIPDILTPNM